jgi:membrane-bound ClpP family serine protease
MDPWVWAVLLLALAVMFAVFESFIPSGGVLAFLGLLFVLASIILGFLEGIGYGLCHMTACFIGIPIAAYLFAKYWGKTPIGRRILLEERSPDDVLPDMLSDSGLKQLVGRTGTAKTKMLLSGAIEIDGQTFDAFSDGAAIMPGAPIQIMKVRGTRITVREIALSEVTPDDPPSQPIISNISGSQPASHAGTTVFELETPPETPSSGAIDDSPLSQSLESLDIEDPFADE